MYPIGIGAQVFVVDVPYYHPGEVVAIHPNFEESGKTAYSVRYQVGEQFVVEPFDASLVTLVDQPMITQLSRIALALERIADQLEHWHGTGIPISR